MDLFASLTIGKKLGEGAFGEVFEASEPVLGKLAVKMMKRLPGESTGDWTTRAANLLDEGQRLHDAHGPHVVEVKQLARSQDGTEIHLAMELCEGSLVEDYISGPMPLDDLKTVVIHVSQGLHAIHARGMIHRDIKPSNILRKNGSYKIGDFGLVTDKLVFGYASARGYITHLAPEVFRDDFTTIKSDQWALGMTIYRLLHGADFFEDFTDSIGDQATALSVPGFAFRLWWLPHIPDGWRRLVRKLLNDEPSQRFDDPVAIAQCVGKIENGPAWLYEASGDLEIWRREKGSRRIEVIRKTHSPRKHEWSATSLGVGAKPRIRLNGTPTSVAASKCHAALEQFFRASK